jgi:undecaprenyl-diphosphatase
MTTKGGETMLEAITGFDFKILDFIHNNMNSPLMDNVMKFITRLGNGGAIWIIIAILMLCSKKYRMTGITVIAGLLIGLIIGNAILKNVFGRIRPFEIKEGIELLIKAPTDFSFPSGHTLSSTIASLIIVQKHRKEGYVLIVLAALIAFSRLYLYVHFPTDVFAGIVLGCIIAFSLVRAVDFFLKKLTKQENNPL